METAMLYETTRCGRRNYARAILTVIGPIVPGLIIANNPVPNNNGGPKTIEQMTRQLALFVEVYQGGHKTQWGWR